MGKNNLAILTALTIGMLTTACNKLGDDLAPIGSAPQKYPAGILPRKTPSLKPPPVPLVIWKVATLAGSGAMGAANGAGTVAAFNNPHGVATDTSGNVYVADTFNNLIRKISQAGVVVTLAGSGATGFANGTGTAASFYHPYGVAADAAGNVYVADDLNDAIRVISAAGVVTTLAGNGGTGYANGTGTAAAFNNPFGVALDANGNVYVADVGNNVIRKISPAGVVTTLAGSGIAGFANGTGTAASFKYPTGVAVDGNGNVYVADVGNNLIRIISPAGVVSTLAGSGTAGFVNGKGTAAAFNYPSGVAVDASGNVYVADVGNSAIRQITQAGIVTTIAGNGYGISANGPGSVVSFYAPFGLATDNKGNIYVADTNNNLIEKMTGSAVNP